MGMKACLPAVRTEQSEWEEEFTHAQASTHAHTQAGTYGTKAIFHSLKSGHRRRNPKAYIKGLMTQSGPVAPVTPGPLQCHVCSVAQ